MRRTLPSRHGEQCRVRRRQAQRRFWSVRLGRSQSLVRCGDTNTSRALACLRWGVDSPVAIYCHWERDMSVLQRLRIPLYTPCTELVRGDDDVDLAWSCVLIG